MAPSIGHLYCDRRSFACAGRAQRRSSRWVRRSGLSQLASRRPLGTTARSAARRGTFGNAADRLSDAADSTRQTVRQARMRQLYTTPSSAAVSCGADCFQSRTREARGRSAARGRPRTPLPQCARRCRGLRAEAARLQATLPANREILAFRDGGSQPHAYAAYSCRIGLCTCTPSITTVRVLQRREGARRDRQQRCC